MAELAVAVAYYLVGTVVMKKFVSSLCQTSMMFLDLDSCMVYSEQPGE